MKPKSGKREEEAIWMYQELPAEQQWEAAVDNAWIQEIIREFET